MFTVREYEERYQKSLIECYQKVFAGPPWNEIWSTEEVEKILCSGKKWWVVLDQERVIGFTVGWITNAVQLAEELGVSPAALPNKTLGYQADIGVLEPFRKQGLARSLAKIRLDWFLKNEVEVLLLRSKPAAVTYEWLMRKGYKEIFRYHDGRVLLARAATNIKL